MFRVGTGGLRLCWEGLVSTRLRKSSEVVRFSGAEEGFGEAVQVCVCFGVLVNEERLVAVGH
jgi:hypothetical protein